MIVVTTLAKGQIVIPAELRRRLGIHPGSRLEIRVEGDHLELHPAPADPIAALRGSVPRGSGSLADALAEEHRREVEGDD